MGKRCPLLIKRVKDSPNGKEADTYKIGTTANSTSTMHKITSNPITLDCFETGDYNENFVLWSKDDEESVLIKDKAQEIIDFCERLRKEYIEKGDMRYWKELIRWLPESWLQTRTWTANYEVLYNMVWQRSYHKLGTEWGEGFVHWCTTLPYAKELIFFGGEREKIYNAYA